MKTDPEDEGEGWTRACAWEPFSRRQKRRERRSRRSCIFGYFLFAKWAVVCYLLDGRDPTSHRIAMFSIPPRRMPTAAPPPRPPPLP